MKRRDRWGSSYASLGGLLGTPRGLGAVAASRQAILLQDTELAWALLDVVGQRFNDAARAGVPDATLERWREARSTLRASLQRLQDRVSALQTEADVGTWQAAYDEIVVAAEQLKAEVAQSIEGRREGQLWRVGLWTGGVTLGVLGAIVLIRWYGAKTRRRRRR